MKEYVARAKSLAFNVQYHDIDVTEREISRRVLNNLSPAYALEKRNFVLRSEFSLSEMEGGPVRVGVLNRSSDGTDGSHALATGFKARSDGRSGGRGGHNDGGRDKREGKGRLPNQRQPPYQPRHQRVQPAHQSQQNSISRGTSESSPRINSNISDRNRNRSTSGISRDINHRSPYSI